LYTAFLPSPHYPLKSLSRGNIIKGNCSGAGLGEDKGVKF